MLGFGLAFPLCRYFETLAANLFEESFIPLVPEVEFQVFSCEVGLEVAHEVLTGDWLNMLLAFNNGFVANN
jgi:hypothetical protein